MRALRGVMRSTKDTLHTNVVHIREGEDEIILHTLFTASEIGTRS